MVASLEKSVKAIPLALGYAVAAITMIAGCGVDFNDRTDVFLVAHPVTELILFRLLSQTATIKLQWFG